MHISVMEFIRNNTNSSMFKNRVLEVGSLDVNGSVRPFIMEFMPKEYIGVDIVEGEGVDRVLPAEELVEKYGKDSFGTVISTEMLEHATNWRGCINNMKDVTSDYLIITTRGPGFPHHEYPHDAWRYTIDDFKRIFADFKPLVLIEDWLEPGVFYIGRKTAKPRVDLSGVELQLAP